MHRRKDDCNPGVAAQLFITLKVARISTEILVWSELGGINEDAHDDGVALRPAGFDQREVPVVQIAHGRHETDPFVGSTRLCNREAKLSDRRDCLHVEFYVR